MADVRPKRVLVILREHIGDVANSTAYLLALQKHFTEAEFTVDVGSAAAPVLENFPGIRRMWRRPKHEKLGERLKYIAAMRRSRFDLAVILDDSSRFVLEAFLGRVPMRAGIHRKRFASLFTHRVESSKERHDSFDPFNELLAKLGVPVPEPRPTLFPNGSDVLRVESLLRDAGDLGQGLVGLNPSTAKSYCRWPAERWAQLAKKLAAEGYTCALLGTEADAEFNRRIAEEASTKLLDWSGKLSVLQLYEMCGRLAYLISVDTGTAHLAAGWAVKSVVLYGPTDPKRFHPYGSAWTAVRAADRTMDSVTVQMVQEAFDRLRADSGSSSFPKPPESRLPS